MEKISGIVRSNSRVASTDLKSSSSVRPGMPSFGRPVGESTQANVNTETTASRAVALHNELLAKKKTGGDQVVQQMADSFFMTRIARPPEEPETSDVQAIAAPRPDTTEVSEVASTDDLVVSKAKSEDEEDKQPVGYKPRGTYVDVRV